MTCFKILKYKVVNGTCRLIFWQGCGPRVMTGNFYLSGKKTIVLEPFILHKNTYKALVVHSSDHN